MRFSAASLLKGDFVININGVVEALAVSGCQLSGRFPAANGSLSGNKWVTN
jgi:hypothetical protein